MATEEAVGKAKGSDVQTTGSPEMMELGVTGLNYQGGRVHSEFLRQLQGDRAWKIYQEMSENDPVVGAMFYALETLMSGVALEVEPFGDEPGDEDAAEFLESLMDDMSHSREQWFSEWMACPTFGFAPFEIVWKLRQGAKERPGESSKHDDGRLGIRKLAIRHPTTLVRWVFDEAGGVQAMVQRSGSKLAEMPIEKLLLFTVQSRRGSPEGTSLLRRSYVPWYRKKHIENIESIGIERDLAGLPHFQVPPAWLGTDATDSQVAMLNMVKKVGRRIRQDDQVCVVTPLMLDADGNELFKFSLVSTAGRRQFDTDKVVQRHDQRIAMTILADIILLGHEKVGSLALANNKNHLFAAGLSSLLDGIAGVLNRHLVPRVLAYNGMDTSRPPTYRFGDLEAVDLAELGEYLGKLTGSGMTLFPTDDLELERELLRLARLPISGVEGAVSGTEAGAGGQQAGEVEEEVEE